MSEFSFSGFGFGLRRRRAGAAGVIDSLLAQYRALGASTAYYDWSKTDDQWQEITGLTPADDPTEPIALKLDRSTWGGKTFAQVLAGQPYVLEERVNYADTAALQAVWTSPASPSQSHPPSPT